MKWWYKACDWVVETVTRESNNAGAIGFRTKCLGVWNVGWATLAVVSAIACPVVWVPIVLLVPVWYAAIWS